MMKIGLFTDSYHPSTNGIVIVVDILRENLQKQGHQVYVIAPRPGLRSKHNPIIKGANVIWVPAVDGILFDEYKTSVFLPQTFVNKLDKYCLEVIIFFTPGQIGMTGAYYAKRNNIPLVEQYCTDLVEYLKEYPNILPPVLALSMATPYIFKMNIKNVAILTDQIIRKRNKKYSWSQDTIRKVLTNIHNSCDALISVSPKITKVLKNDGVKTRIETIPTGVDKLKTKPKDVYDFRKRWGVLKNEVLVLSVGRTAPEKNLGMLIEAFSKVALHNKQIKLIFVGDFAYKKVLQEKANKTKHSDRIIFTGRVKRETLESIYKGADIFAFPSVTDAQALVLNEAAHSSLPIVWCDKEVNDVVKDGINGVLTKNNPNSFAKGLERLINSKSIRIKYGTNSQKLAKQFLETKQTKKIVKLFEEIVH